MAADISAQHAASIFRFQVLAVQDPEDAENKLL